MDKRDSTSIIKIIGEEDLIVLPAMLTAPLGASIFYGQPGDGIVYVPVDEKAKKKARNLISRFEKKK